MKIVLDTNVLVSGLLNPQGNPAQVVALAMAGAIQVCHDQRILDEYAEVLARPRFQFDSQRVREVLTKLEVDGLPVDAAQYSHLGLPDPDDEPFLAVALAASADFLVTGNLSDYPPAKLWGCTVASPAEFVKRWQKLSREE
ncbi:MAG: putative toxin-antitoxin system toxin component, PIN family [Verrucomicrobiota bacterium]